MRLGLGVAGLTLAVSAAQAQGRVAVARAGRTSATLTRGGGANSRFPRRAPIFGGSGYFPYFYPDYGYDQEYNEVPPDRFIERDAEPEPSAPARVPAEALMIELQGDHWVRVTNNGRDSKSEESPASSPRSADRVCNPRLYRPAATPKFPSLPPSCRTLYWCSATVIRRKLENI